MIYQNLESRLVTICSIGTILEWYDFSLYAYLAPIISELYFPSEDPSTSIILAYSVFAIGFIVRPLGAIIFGHFGDRIGRKKILVLSMAIMASTTFLIALLPTYNQIGLIAPVCLVIIRILQGIAIGGEAIGASSLIIESSPTTKRGYFTALIWASSGIGILASSIIISAVSLIYSKSIILSWAWRVPFLIGGFTGLIAYYIRKNIPESVLFS